MYSSKTHSKPVYMYHTTAKLIDMVKGKFYC